MIVEVPINNVPITDFNIKKKPIPQSDNSNLPALFHTAIFAGSKGRGKTHSLVSLLTLYENSKISDGIATYKIKIFLIAPTAYSSANSIYQSLKSLDKKDIYLEYTDEILQGILDEIKDNNEEYNNFIEYKGVYEKFAKKGGESKLTDDEMILLNDYEFQSPEEVFGELNPYVNWIIFDDLVGTGSFNRKAKSLISNLTIKHRHLKTNLFFTTQGIKQLPPIIRNNIDIYVIFKSASNKEILDRAYEDLSGYIPYDNFKEFYDYSTSDNHDALVVINNTTNNKGLEIRKNWDKKLLLK